MFIHSAHACKQLNRTHVFLVDTKMILNINPTTSADRNPTAIKFLKSTFGLGHSRSRLLCKLGGVCENYSAEKLDSDQLDTLINLALAHGFVTGQELKKQRIKDFEKSVNIKSYKGMRKTQGYPARGQRTHSNAKTARKKFR